MNRTPIITIISSILLATAAAHATVLYDGSSTPTTRLDQSPWNWTSAASTPDPTTNEVFTESAAGGINTFNTTQAAVVSPPPTVFTGIKAGYANLANTLNETTGYKLDFNIAITAETAGDPSVHSDTADRAGFSVIALSSDHLGVELAFWQNNIWAQSNTFSGHSTTLEQANVSTSGMNAYELTVQGGSYSLTQNGTFLFGGALKNYTANGSVYLVPNFLFLGDDTTARSATANIAFVSVNPVPVPEPASLGLLGVGIAGLLSRRRGARASVPSMV